RSRVLTKHAVRNALIPVVTVFGLSLISVFGIAVQTEFVFNLPGLGSSIADAAVVQDAPIVLGLSTVVIVFAALMNLVVDLSSGLIAPRIRVGNAREQR